MKILDKLKPKISKKKDNENDEENLFEGGKLKGVDYPQDDSAISPDIKLKDKTLAETTPIEESLEYLEPKKIDEVEAPKVPVVKTIPGSVKAVNNKLLDGWEQWLSIERNRADTTCEAYIGDLRMFKEFVISRRNGSLKSVGIDDIREFVKNLRIKGCGPSAVNRRLSALKTFYAWALREGYVKLNPASSELIDRFKIPERLPIHLTESEHEHFMNALEFHTPREKAFIALMNLSGLRISEACSLRMEHLIKERDKIVAIRVIGKGNKERIAPIHPVLSGYINNWLSKKRGKKSGYLFPGNKDGHINRITGWRWFNEFKAKVGIKDMITPHKLRHTFATRLHQNGVPLLDLQKMLGHADPRTTAIYAHVDYEALQEHIKKLI